MSTQFSPTWNNSGVDFTCIKANVIDTNSGSGSTLLDLQINGTSKFNVLKSGVVNSSGLTLSGDLLFTDALYDIGKSGATRPRDGFFSRDLTVGQQFKPSSTTSQYTPSIQNTQFGTGTGINFTAAGTFFVDNNSYVVHIGVGGQRKIVLGCDLRFASSIGATEDLYLLRDAADTLALRRSTNAQTFCLYETYTSSTSFGTLQFKANAGGAYQIGSAIGNAGGTNRAISFGRWNTAGTFSSYLSVNTDGTLTFLGSYGLVSNNYNLQLTNTTSSAFACTAFGFSASAGHSSTVAIGTNSTTTAAGQCVIGGNAAGITSVFIGNGVTHGTPDSVTYNATGGSGTNIAGANFTLAGGRGTGSAAGGSLIFQTAPAGSSGTSANSLVTRLTIDSTGASTFSGVVLASGGSQSNPGYSFAGNTGSGLYLIDSNTLAFISNGTKTFDIYGQYLRAFGRVVVGNSGAYCFTSGSAPSGGLPDVFIYGEAANTVALRNDTAAQTLRVYNTYTSTTSFENLQFKANVGAAYQIGSAIGSAGGTTRSIDLGYWDSAGTFKQVVTTSTTGIFIHEYPYRSGEGITISQPTNSATIHSTRNLIFDSTNGNIYISDNKQYLFFGTGGQSYVGGTTHVYLQSAKNGNVYIRPMHGYDNSGGTFVDIRGCNAWASSTGTITGGVVYLTGGNGASSSLGVASGGAVTIAGGIGYGAGVGGNINLTAGAGPTGGTVVITQPTSTTGSPTAFTITGAAHTTLTASTEATDINFNLARTVQFATGALTTQRAFRIQAPTYSFVGASTITTASTLSISGEPAAGTNATITNAYALEISSGRIGFTGGFGTGGIYFNGAGAYYAPHISTGSNQLVIAAQSQVNWIFSNSQYMQFYNGNIATTGSIELGGSTSGTGDVILIRDAANTFAQRNSTNAQTLRVYNTYTSATSGEMGELRWASNVLYIGSNKGSAGGSARDVAITHGGTVVANFLSDRFYLGPIADSTATGGNARGAGSVDLQLLRGSAGQVASGTNSVVLGGGSNRATSDQCGTLAGTANTASGQRAVTLGGYGCTASGQHAIAGGFQTTASGQSSVSFGYNSLASGQYTYAMGVSATASANYSYSLGYNVTSSDSYTLSTGLESISNKHGQRSHAAGKFASQGDAQYVRYVARIKTTDNTPATLMLDGSTSRLTVTSGKILFCEVSVSGVKSDGSASACFKRKLAIKNVAGTTSLVGVVEIIGSDIKDNPLSNIAITADDVNDALQINVTGINTETWRWVAIIEGVEVAYGT